MRRSQVFVARQVEDSDGARRISQGQLYSQRGTVSEAASGVTIGPAAKERRSANHL
jgi:hypothetical protein